MSNGIGGNLFSTALSAIGGAIGGPIGAMVGQMFSQIVSQVVESAIQEVGQKAGLPQAAIDTAQGAFQSAAGHPGQAASEYGDALQGAKQNLSPEAARDLQDGVDNLKDQVRQSFNDAMNDVAEGGSGTSKGKHAKGDFFTAMAEALGKALQSQADKVEKLSNELADATDTANSAQGDSKTSANNDLMLLQTQVSAESSRLNFMSQGIQTALAKIGESLTTLGRSQ